MAWKYAREPARAPRAHEIFALRVAGWRGIAIVPDHNLGEELIYRDRAIRDRECAAEAVGDMAVDYRDEPTITRTVPRSASALFQRLCQQLRQCMHCVEMWTRRAGQTRQLDDRAEQGVDFERASCLDILQHRRLVMADALGTRDALFERHSNRDAELFGD